MWRVSRLWVFLWFAVRAGAIAPECLILPDDALRAGDLARREPAFAAISAATRVAWAPSPGVTRWISAGEMVRLGREYGVTAAPAGLCVARSMETLERARILAAMQAATPELHIELIDFGPRQTPPGKVEFALRDLPHLPRQSSVPVVQWRGHVSTGSRAYPVWARARVVVRREALVAVRALSPGEVLASEAVRRVELEDYPGWEVPLADAGLVVGRKVRRAVGLGEPLRAQLLSVRREIERGDLVEVLLPGEATLTAQAESPGRLGERILLKNPLTGGRFPARVTGIGRAEMAAEPAAPARSRKPVEVAADARP